MLLCACSVVIATFQLLLLVALLVTVTIGLVIKRHFPEIIGSTRMDGMILVNLCARDESTISDVTNLVGGFVSKGRVEGLTELNELITLHYSFCDLNTDRLDSLHMQLTAHKDIESVNVYYNRLSSLL